MVPLRHLTSVPADFAARVLVARLEAEGLDVEVRGPGNPYGVTVGDLGRLDLYVPADQLEEASLVLLAAEVDAAVDDPAHRVAPRTAAPATRVIAGAMLVVLVAALCARVL